MKSVRLSDLVADMASGGQPSLRNRILFSSVDSTNTVGKRIAAIYQKCREPLPPTVLIALEQNSGRGRRGNRWLSPPGGIYLSLVQRVEGRDQLAMLPIRVGSEVCRELDSMLDGSCRLKWPNDLMVAGRKIGGILIESVGGSEARVAVIGLGINYSAPPPELERTATSITNEASAPPSQALVISRLITALVSIPQSGLDESTILQRYQEWSCHQIGERLCCRTAAGSRSGTFLGFGPQGILRLMTASGECLVPAGEIIEEEGGEPYES